MDPEPCSVCGRRYGHLAGCRVEELHRELDDKIRRYGAAQVYVGALKSASEVEKERTK